MGIIYQITNVVNGKTYIGLTTKTIKERFNGHVAAANHGSKSHLHNSIRKYGSENFKIETIEHTDSPSEREMYWISELNPQMNMTTGGEGMNGFASFGMLGKTQSKKWHSAIKKSNSCPVSCDGLVFESQKEAQEHFGLKNIRRRLNSSSFPNWFRLKEKRFYPSRS